MSRSHGIGKDGTRDIDMELEKRLQKKRKEASNSRIAESRVGGIFGQEVWYWKRQVTKSGTELHECCLPGYIF